MKYFVATNEKDVFHWGEYDPDTQQFTTGQPIVNEYDTEDEMYARLDELGVVYKDPEEEGEGESREEDIVQQEPFYEAWEGIE